MWEGIPFTTEVDGEGSELGGTDAREGSRERLGAGTDGPRAEEGPLKRGLEEFRGVKLLFPVGELLLLLLLLKAAAKAETLLPTCLFDDENTGVGVLR